MKLLSPVSTPYGPGKLGGRDVDKDGNTRAYLVSIRRADYLRNYPGVPVCDGPCINILVSEDQVREIGA
jgi:hypothetical protein